MGSREEIHLTPEFATVEGHLELSQDDIRNLIKMAMEATGHAAASFQYMYETAYQTQDQDLHDRLTKLENETLGAGIVIIGDYFTDVEADNWSIPVLGTDGTQLTDEFYVNKLNVKDMTMLCTGLGPFVEDATSEEGQYAHHITFKASYTEPSQELEVLWSKGAQDRHPNTSDLRAQFDGSPPPEGQPFYSFHELYNFRDSHHRKLQDIGKSQQQA